MPRRTLLRDANCPEARSSSPASRNEVKSWLSQICRLWTSHKAGWGDDMRKPDVGDSALSRQTEHSPGKVLSLPVTHPVRRSTTRVSGSFAVCKNVMIGVFIDPGYRPPIPAGPAYKKVSTPPDISLDKTDVALLRNVEKAGVYGIRIWELLNRVADEQNPATRAEARALRLKLWQNLRRLLRRGAVCRRARKWVSGYLMPRATVNRRPKARQARWKWTPVRT